MNTSMEPPATTHIVPSSPSMADTTRTTPALADTVPTKIYESQCSEICPNSSQSSELGSDFYNGDFNFTWNYGWRDIIRHHIANLEPKPSYLVLNTGLWPHDLRLKKKLREIHQALDDTGIVGICKTTTGARSRSSITSFKPHPHEFQACKIFSSLRLNTWTYDLPDDAY
mmetsp:Transcript_57098/g.139127  ORF Transcript_57098/g.139127 Transcript_57098/m.139127 type:complete len:170 (-) Transcript_57098:278-787(-)